MLRRPRVLPTAAAAAPAAPSPVSVATAVPGVKVTLRDEALWLVAEAGAEAQVWRKGQGVTSVSCAQCRLDDGDIVRLPDGRNCLVTLPGVEGRGVEVHLFSDVMSTVCGC